MALHAVKNYDAALAFGADNPGAPIVVALTGTDLYGPRSFLPALRLSARIIVLQERGLQKVPRSMRERARAIYQSARPLQTAPAKLSTRFQIAVIGNLRPVKDPFRAAMAVRDVPADSRLAIRHAGRALSPEMEERARAEMRRNERYRWVGEIPRHRARRLLASSHLVAITSKAEAAPTSFRRRWWRRCRSW